GWHLDVEPRLHLEAGFTAAAYHALDVAARSVQLDHAPAPRVLMQAVGVLRDDGDQPAARLQLGERHMTSVRPGRERHATPFPGHLPVRRWIGHETVDRRDLHGVVLGPYATLAPKRRNAALGGHPGAGHRDRTRGRCEEV